MMLLLLQSLFCRMELWPKPLIQLQHKGFPIFLPLAILQTDLMKRPLGPLMLPLLDFPVRKPMISPGVVIYFKKYVLLRAITLLFFNGWIAFIPTHSPGEQKMIWIFTLLKILMALV